MNMPDEQKELDAEEDRFEPEPEEAGSSTNSGSSTQSREALVLDLLRQVQESIAHAVNLLAGGDTDKAREGLSRLISAKAKVAKAEIDQSGARVVEGVFDGAAMTGGDGKSYVVPPNYASKSRLVEGDVMKLTIRSDGSFVYKQIGPVERRRIVGELSFDETTNSYLALCDGAPYKLLTASVTYFKGQPGDEVVILVPSRHRSVWAAVENVVKK